jgi:hypothetical protein
MKKIFCFGDGFATGHIWPEWPQILQALVPDYKVITTAGIGAGPEFLVSGFVDVISELHNSLVIFQWPNPERFDKIIEDENWYDIIAKDPVYYFNINKDIHGHKWWLSSASNTEDVRNYHKHYIQPTQHQLRQSVYQTLVDHSAKNLNCQIIYTSTASEHAFSNESRFAITRLSQIQPSPIVHFYWLLEKIIPQTEMVINSRLQEKLELLINQTTWIPYDPDREEIWNNIKQQINNISG